MATLPQRRGACIPAARAVRRGIARRAHVRRAGWTSCRRVDAKCAAAPRGPLARALATASVTPRRSAPMEIDRLTVAEALASLQSGPAGLGRAEAQRRLREYGPNEVAVARRTRALAELAGHFIGPFPIVLLVAAALAFLLAAQAPGGDMLRLAIAIVVVVVVSGAFSYWQAFRAERTLAALQRLLPARARVLRDGHLAAVPTVDLVPGDVVILQAGDRVPADCRVIDGEDARIDLSTVTGESAPQPCEAAVARDNEHTRPRNVLLAGTAVVAGKVTAVVFATGPHTEFGTIARLTQHGGSERSPLQRQLDHLSRRIVALAVGLGLLFFAIGWAIGIPVWADLIFAIGIIVAMVPEGLLPTLTLALVLTGKRMAARHVLIRHLAAVEALGSTTVICTDKTGTLTQNRMTVRSAYLGGEIAEADCVLRERAFAHDYRGFFETAALCHDLPPAGQASERPGPSGDPTELALLDFATHALSGAPAPPRLGAIAFDARRMRLTTLYALPDGPILYCKGAPETVLPLCTRMLRDGRIEALSAAARTGIERAHGEMAARGLRVLALAYRPLTAAETKAADASAADPLARFGLLERELVFAGLAGLEDPPRPEVPAAIARCREAGIKVIMVTGDHPATALAIGREIGIIATDTPSVVTGERLQHMSATQLQLALDAPEIVFARVQADQKMRIVEALKRKREIVAVTGDGVNDAPALKAAHIGVAMGASGTDVAREAADIVLLDDNFASIVAAVEEGRAVFDNIRRFLTYILAHNVPEVVPYLAFALFKVPLALTPIQILAIDMGTDSLTALGLGVDKPDPRIMQRPPRPPDEKLLDWGVALRAYGFLGAIEAVAAMAVFFHVLYGGGWQPGTLLAPADPLYLQATTACLVAIVVMQSINVFICRSGDGAIFTRRRSRNPLIPGGVLFGLLLTLAIVYTPHGNAFFGTTPVGAAPWLFVLPFAAALIGLEFVRRRMPPSPLARDWRTRPISEHPE